MAKYFGQPSGVTVGQNFASRQELADAGVHPPLQAGIHGTKKDGADSIVVSGGYKDDQDDGDVIIYTGMGGNDPATKKQIADQTPDRFGNAGLITSEIEGLPVRVTRGANGPSLFAPNHGFRYDGLYAVVAHWNKVGVDGFNVILFRLEKLLDDEPSAGPQQKSDAKSYLTTTVTRRIRDSAQARAVKVLHKDECQVCGVVIEVEGARRYSEGAHIQPLGHPHDGPDLASNLLCLCPNHHAQLDYGGLIINEDLTIVERATGTPIGQLRTRPKHVIDPMCLAYRRGMYP